MVEPPFGIAGPVAPRLVPAIQFGVLEIERTLIAMLMNRSLLAALAALLLAAPLTGQSISESDFAWNPQGLQMTRAELESLVRNLEDVARSPAYSDRLRERARSDAEAVQERLSVGDFRVGDRVLLDVEGEEQLPDTLTVEPGPSVTLPVMGEISLQGVLRSELEEHLTRELGQFIRDPVVRARALVRMSIQGSVGAPGFYTLPAEMLVGDALMRAGGPAPNADLDDLEIRRAGQTLWSGIELRDAMIEGRTLDQLNVRAGDEIRVSLRAQRPWWETALRYGIPTAASLFLGVRAIRSF